MAIKTKPSGLTVTSFIDAIDDKARRADCRAIMKMMRAATGHRPKMWGTSLVGYGSYDYKYDSGQEGSWPLTAFSPRKQSLVVYIMPGFSAYGSLMAKLGKHKTGKSCLYIKRLADVDPRVLAQLIDKSVRAMRKRYG